MPKSFLRAVARFAVAGLAAAAWHAAAAQDSIRIGVIGPMAFAQGENHWAGAELARDEINAAGGIRMGAKSLKVELVRADSNEMHSPADAANAMERIITRDKSDVVVGGFRSEAVLAMQEVAMDYKKLFLGCGAADAKLGQNVETNYARYKYWFRITPNKSPDLGRTLFAVLGTIAQQIRARLGKDTPRVAILAEKLAWTKAIVGALQAKLPEMKMKVVGLWQPSPTATDVSAELSAIERANADIVFTVLSGPVGISVGRQMGERGMRAVAFGVNVEAQKDGFWAASAGKANYVATLDTFGEVGMTPKTLPFVHAFEARFHHMPTYNAGTYDAIMLLKQAIERTGTTDPDRLVAELEKTTYVGAAGVIKFDKHHDPEWGPGKVTGIAVQWQNGRKLPFWPPDVEGMKPFRMPAGD